MSSSQLRTISDSPRPRATRLPPEERRAQLLECALRVFARGGLSGARLPDVAADAGVAESTLFVYFRTREELVSAVLDEVDRFYTELVQTSLASDDRPVPAALRNLAGNFTDSVASHPDHARIWLEWSSSIREEFWARYIAFQERLIAHMAETFERGQREGTIAPDIHTGDEARILYGMAAMIVQLMFTGRPRAEIDRFLGSIIETLRLRVAPDGP